MVAVLMKLCLQFAQYGTINIHVKTQSVVLVVCYICLCVYLPTYSFNCTFWKWQTQSNTPNRMRFDYQKDKSYPNTVSLQIDHRWFIINGFQRVYWKFSNFCPKYPGPKSDGSFKFFISQEWHYICEDTVYIVSKNINVRNWSISVHIPKYLRH